MKFTLDLDMKSKDDAIPGLRRYVWRLLSPIPAHIRLLLGDSPMGSWTQNSTGFSLYAKADRSTVVMELRQVGIDSPNGPAFGIPKPGRSGGEAYHLRGTWSASAKPLPKTWVGIMGKGSAGLGLGAEGGVGAVAALGFGNHGACFSFGSGRVIAGGGFSGGLALIIATGFNSSRDFHNYSSEGADWALSIGENLKSIATSGRLAKLGPVLKALSAVDKSVTKAEQYYKAVYSSNFSKEIYGVMKGILQTSLIDTDAQNLTAIDIPLAGVGAEAGFYYSWSQYKLLKSW